MARSRIIKPGFFKNEVLADCDMAARLLYAGLWTIADREGRLEDRPKRIKAELLPYDNVDADVLLGQLAEHGFIVRYVAAGQPYIAIPTFTKNQQPHVNEAPSSIPLPEDTVLYKEEYRTSTVQVPEQHGANSPSYLNLDTESLNTESLSGAVASDAPTPTAKPKRDKERETSIPDNFAPTAKMIADAQKKYPDMDISAASDRWIGSMKANKSKYRRTNWNQAWWNGMDQAEDGGWHRLRSDNGSGKARGSPYNPPLDAAKYQEGGRFGHLFTTPKKETA